MTTLKTAGVADYNLGGVGFFSSDVGVCAPEEGFGFRVLSLNQRLQLHYLAS